jgi:hypothetical protein
VITLNEVTSTTLTFTVNFEGDAAIIYLNYYYRHDVLYFTELFSYKLYYIPVIFLSYIYNFIENNKPMIIDEIKRIRFNNE